MCAMGGFPQRSLILRLPLIKRIHPIIQEEGCEFLDDGPSEGPALVRFCEASLQQASVPERFISVVVCRWPLRSASEPL